MHVQSLTSSGSPPCRRLLSALRRVVRFDVVHVRRVELDDDPVGLGRVRLLEGLVQGEGPLWLLYERVHHDPSAVHADLQTEGLLARQPRCAAFFSRLVASSPKSNSDRELIRPDPVLLPSPFLLGFSLSQNGRANATAATRSRTGWENCSRLTRATCLAQVRPALRCIRRHNCETVD